MEASFTTCGMHVDDDFASTETSHRQKRRVTLDTAPAEPRQSFDEAGYQSYDDEKEQQCEDDEGDDEQRHGDQVHRFLLGKGADRAYHALNGLSICHASCYTPANNFVL